MATILAFLRPGTSFGPMEVAAMGAAFDRACAELDLADSAAGPRQALAAEIVALAGLGDCDSDHLCDATLVRRATAPLSEHRLDRAG